MPFRISQPSFQSLYMEMLANGHTIACGTAFVANSSSGSSFLLTNRHNVTGRHQDTGELLCKRSGAIPDTLAVWHNSYEYLGHFVRVDMPLFDGGTPQWIEHPVLQENADIVAFPLATCQNIALYPYQTEYYAHMHVEPAQAVSVVGFPFGLRTGSSFAVWATGFVASEPEIDHGGRRVFLIDCRTRTGQSGSPVIRYQNGGGLITHENGPEVISPVCRLLGMYSGRINDDSDLGVVWKTSVIAELLDCASSPY